MKQYQKISLPIDAYSEEILTKIRESSTVLIKASPGSGKTTRLPWLMASHLPGKVVVLEPRRLAAKLAAQRIAFEEGFKIGEEIGYQFRFENKTSPGSRVLFYTEGTFLRLLMSDPDLKGVSVVILDEFHERHLETDMALAYLLGLKERRPDLKLVLMSATLDTKVLGQLPGAAIIDIVAPHFPVTLSYLPNVPSELNRPIEQKIKSVLPSTGDTLIFLPGMREILKVKDYLGNQFGEVFILHSEAPKEEQDAALAPSSQRKIILSTNIAESSVTIPGIVTVIDSGIARGAHYSPWNGLKFVLDTPVTRAGAIQRAGRAGRTSPGKCFRLYAEQDFNSREEFTVPEIQRADLTEAYLLASELKGELRWPSPPPEERWQKAQELCRMLGLTNPVLRKRSQKYPLDVRLSRVLVAGETLTRDAKKKLLAYVCREIERDLSGMLERRLAFFLDLPGTETNWEKCVLSGFVDQVGKWRPKQRDFIHYSGKTIKAHHAQDLHGDFFIILDITQRQEAIKVFSIDEDWLMDLEPFPFTEEAQFEVGDTFRMKKQTKLGSIVFDENSATLTWSQLSPPERSKLLELARRPFEKRWSEWQESPTYERLHYWAQLKKKEVAAPGPEAYLASCESLSWEEVESYFQSSLETALEVTSLSRELPLTVNFGARRDMKVHYPLNQEPFVEAPIQEFYGVKSTPIVAGVPLTMRLLGPHKRPIQVTKDLAGFWKKTYQEMKKELMREYPRHHWPEDPTTAPPLLLKSHLPK